MHQLIILPENIKCENDFYLINGIKYWRITRIKSIINIPELNDWRAKVGYGAANRIMEERKHIGNIAHDAFDKILKNNSIEADNFRREIKKDIELFYKFIDDCSITVSSSEQILYSNELKIAGTADYTGFYKSNKKYLKNKKPKFDDDCYFLIGDWKTSSKIYEDYWLQLVAYCHMYREMSGIKPDGAFIALFRDGKLEIEEKTWDELEKYYNIFLSCIKVFKYKIGEY